VAARQLLNIHTAYPIVSYRIQRSTKSYFDGRWFYSCFCACVMSRVGCRDESKYCNLIPALHMCRYPQYRHRCCQSCSRHAIAPAPFRSAHRYVAWRRRCPVFPSPSKSQTSHCSSSNCACN